MRDSSDGVSSGRASSGGTSGRVSLDGFFLFLGRRLYSLRSFCLVFCAGMRRSIGEDRGECGPRKGGQSGSELGPSRGGGYAKRCDSELGPSQGGGYVAAGRKIRRIRLENYF